MKTSDQGVSAQKEISERYYKLYSMLLDAIPSSVLLIDRDMHIISVNRNFLEKSHRSPSDTIGHKLSEIFPSIILQDMNIVNKIREVFYSNQPTKGERMTYRVPGFPMRFYYYRILPFSWRGTVENAVFLMDDVTEQIRLSEEVRQAERYLASVVESASDIVMSADVAGKLRTWNSAAEKISGYTFHEVKNKYFYEYITGDHKKEAMNVIQKMKTENNPQMTEWNLVTKQGNSIVVSWVFSPMKDYLFQTIGMVAVGRDQTEHRKIEMQLFQSQKLASLGVMAGGIAHEIRNPLAVCSSAAQFLLDYDITPEFRMECANKIIKGIQRASSIIEDLLKLARPSSYTKMEDVNLIYLLTEVLTLVTNQASIQKIELSIYFPQKSVLIKGVNSLLQQLFLNIILNAINSMPDGGMLSMTVEKTESEVLVHISDTGKGIPKNEIDRIFDPFYTTSLSEKGIGLGLAICYSIANQHSGVIEVSSCEGKGSTFTVRFPVK